jgi:hypothetical protein
MQQRQQNWDMSQLSPETHGHMSEQRSQLWERALSHPTSASLHRLPWNISKWPHLKPLAHFSFPVDRGERGTASDTRGWLCSQFQTVLSIWSSNHQ